jgi:hypothetical protein
VGRSRDEWTPEQWREATEEARRSARFKFAEDRIKRIVAGWPPLTEQQRERLALLLNPGTDNGQGA